MSRYKWWILGALSPTLHEGKTRPPVDLENVKRVLIVRPEKLGDVFVSLPLSDEIRRVAPHVKVSMVVSPRSEGLVRDDPRFEQVFVYHKNIGKDWPMVRRMRAARFDVVIDLVCNDTVTNLFLTQLAARGRPRAGMGKDTLAHYYDFNVPYRSANWGHVIDSTLNVLSVFGQTARPEAGYAPAYASDSRQQRATRMVAEWRQKFGVEKIIGVNVTAGEAMRLWPDEKWVSLIGRLAKGHQDCGFIIIVPPEDRQRGEAIVRRGKGRIVIVPDQLGIADVCAMVGVLDGLITPDTILVHAARSYHVPVVGLYTRFMDNYHMWYPYGQPQGVVLAESERTIADIPVEAVAAACESLLMTEKARTE